MEVARPHEETVVHQVSGVHDRVELLPRGQPCRLECLCGPSRFHVDVLLSGPGLSTLTSDKGCGTREVEGRDELLGVMGCYGSRLRTCVCVCVCGKGNHRSKDHVPRQLRLEYVSGGKFVPGHEG